MTRQKRWILKNPLYNAYWKYRNRDRINKRRREIYRLRRGKFVRLDRQRKHAGTLFIRSLKNVPCRDCGVKYPFYVMHFDHKDPQQKRRSLSRMASYSVGAIRKEAAKCDVVCANCHAKRTYKAVRRGKLKVFGRWYV